MIFVITGDGKGKTTSSLGMVSRACGHDKKCAVLQFIKKDSSQCGEYKTMVSNGVLWNNFGEGFTWQQKTMEPTARCCRQGWKLFKELVCSEQYFLIVLDEFTYVLEEKLLDREDVLAFLLQNKGKTNINIVITGRRADKELIDIADTASEINMLKHHYDSNGNKPLLGIEY